MAISAGDLIPLPQARANLSELDDISEGRGREDHHQAR